MTFAIRRIRKNDAGEIVRLFRELTQYIRKVGGRADPNFNEQAYLQDGFERRLFEGWAAIADKRIVGYLIGHLGYEVEMASKIFYVINLYVATNHRRSGVARSLMKNAARFAVKNGARGMIWTNDKKNRETRDFYLTLGAKKLELDVMAIKNKDLLQFVKS
jgi:GNAT superfamily N-acetyltransferase